MSKLPFGWENRRNNLTEHDMKLVRVDSRGALTCAGSTRHDTDVWPDDEKKALFYRRVGGHLLRSKTSPDVSIFSHRNA